MKFMMTLLMLMLLIPFAVAQAGPVNGEFTYQGRLVLEELPVTGSADFKFYLYDAQNSGSQVGVVLQLDDVSVENGLFTVVLDFGVPAFDGNDRWLEILVRSPHDPNDTDPFTALDPRQQLTAVPYAMHALNGGGGGGSGYWQANGSNIMNTNSGFVGIGRNDRVTSSEVFGIQAPGDGWAGMYIKSDGAAGLPFYGYKTPNAFVYHYVAETTGNWSLYNNGTQLNFTDTGKLGVGVTAPTSTIQANGVIHSTTGGFKFPDGTIQTTAGGGGGGSSEEVILTDSSANQTVNLRASINGPGTSNGPTLKFSSNSGLETMVLTGGLTSSADLRMYNSDNVRTFWIMSDWSSGDGSWLQMKQGDNDRGVTIMANGGTGEGDRGGEIDLFTVEGAKSLVLHGDYNGTGESRVVTNVVEITGGSDLSENFDIAAGVKMVEPGSVVSIDPTSPGDLRLSTEAYDRKVAGIISGADGIKPGLLMGQKGTEADGEYPVALTGRVYCKVDASFGAIEPGDLLTTSPTPGHAMKVTDFTQAQGAILGKAMTALETGQGSVLVLVSLQ